MLLPFLLLLENLVNGRVSFFKVCSQKLPAGQSIRRCSFPRKVVPYAGPQESSKPAPATAAMILHVKALLVI